MSKPALRAIAARAEVMLDRRRMPLRVLALALLLSALPPRGVVRAQGEVHRIRTVVNDGGWEGNPGDYYVEVEQGEAVEWTFIWDQKVAMQDEHIMTLDGYRLEWDEINKDSREATVQFVADKAGTFTFKCDMDCVIHDQLQRGHLKVKPKAGEGGGAAMLTATSIKLKPSSTVSAGEPIDLMATVRDANGAPVAKADVHFFADVEFAGTKGTMEIGTARTDANGVAFFDYQPTFAARYLKITARFEGMGVYAEAEQSTTVAIVDALPAYTVRPVGLEAVGQWTLAAFLLAIAGVWAVFGYVLFQAYQISRGS